MKTRTILATVTLFIGFFTQAQNLALTFDNAQITNDGSNDFYEADVFITRTTAPDFKVGDGQFYLDYNPLAFGNSIGDVEVDFIYTPGSVLSEVNILPLYTNPIINSNTSTRVSIAWGQAFSAGSMAANNVTTTPTVLAHLKIQMVNAAEAPNICFNVLGNAFDDQFYTACGPFTPGFASKDCVNFPGTQIFDYDGSDCSGSGLPILTCTGSTTFTIAGTWSNGIPTENMAATISGTYDTAINGNIEACQLTIAGSGSLSVKESTYVRVQNDIINDGIFEVMPTGSVVQVNDDAVVTNNTDIIVNVETPFLKPRDFMILGSPMTAATPVIAPDINGDTSHEIFRKKNHITTNFIPHPDVQAAFPGGTNFVDDNGDDFMNYAGIYNPAEGYFTKPQASNEDGNQTYLLEFAQNTSEGTLNSGIITYAVDFNTGGTQEENKNASPNLLANPYPSAISATDFMNANDAVDELYFWEHNTTPDNTYPGYNEINFTMADISVFNDMGFNPASTGSPTPPTSGDFSISTAQGFGIKNNGATTGTGQLVTFRNDMRRVDNNNTLRNPENKDRLWLHLKSDQYELASNILIGFTESATPRFDDKFDSKRVGTPVSLYSNLADGTGELAIQGKEAFNEDMEVGLGFSSQIERNSATFTISLTAMDGELIVNNIVYLRDNILNTETELTSQDYTFTSGAGTYNNRFTLYFKEREILNTSDVALEQINIYPNPAKNLINIYSPSVLISEIGIVDMQGRTIATYKGLETNQKTIDISILSSAVYFISIQTEQGNVTKRIVKQ